MEIVAPSSLFSKLGIGLFCWSFSYDFLMKIGRPSGLGISSSIGPCLIFLFVAFILDKDILIRIISFKLALSSLENLACFDGVCCEVFFELSDT